jgi:hypothetical protein
MESDKIPFPSSSLSLTEVGDDPRRRNKISINTKTLEFQNSHIPLLSTPISNLQWVDPNHVSSSLIHSFIHNSMSTSTRYSFSHIRFAIFSFLFSTCILSFSMFAKKFNNFEPCLTKVYWLIFAGSFFGTCCS